MGEWANVFKIYSLCEAHTNDEVTHHQNQLRFAAHLQLKKICVRVRDRDCVNLLITINEITNELDADQQRQFVEIYNGIKLRIIDRWWASPSRKRV